MKRILRYFIEDYNTIRSHSKLKGSTPDQVWNGNLVPTDLRTKILKQARIDRLEYNRKNRCEKCE